MPDLGLIGPPVVVPIPGVPVVLVASSAPVPVLPIPGPPGAGGGGSSTTAKFTAGETLSGQRVVAVHSDDGLLWYASNDDLADASRQLWLTEGAALEGDLVTALALGPVTEPGWNWTDAPVFLGTNGVLTQTPPTADDGAAFLVQVGSPDSPTSLMFNPRTPIAF